MTNTTAVQMDDRALIAFAQHGIRQLRELAEMMRGFRNTSGRESFVRVCRREVESLRPVIRAATAKFGAELFRRPNVLPSVPAADQTEISSSGSSSTKGGSR